MRYMAYCNKKIGQLPVAYKIATPLNLSHMEISNWTPNGTNNLLHFFYIIQQPHVYTGCLSAVLGSWVSWLLNAVWNHSIRLSHSNSRTYKICSAVAFVYTQWQKCSCIHHIFKTLHECTLYTAAGIAINNKHLSLSLYKMHTQFFSEESLRAHRREKCVCLRASTLCWCGDFAPEQRVRERESDHVWVFFNNFLLNVCTERQASQVYGWVYWCKTRSS